MKYDIARTSRKYDSKTHLYQPTSGHDFFTGILAMDGWSIKVSRLDDETMKSFECKKSKEKLFFLMI